MNDDNQSHITCHHSHSHSQTHRKMTLTPASQTPASPTPASSTLMQESTADKFLSSFRMMRILKIFFSEASNP